MPSNLSHPACFHLSPWHRSISLAQNLGGGAGLHQGASGALPDVLVGGWDTSRSWGRRRAGAGGRQAGGERRPSLQNLRQSHPGTPIVILRDVQSAPKTVPAGEHKPETIRLITKDFVRDLV